MPVTTEIIARAVIRRAGRVLVATPVGEAWCFLPGGHVEPGERVESALVRELAEELGAEARIVRLIGVVENRYVDRAGLHHELNLVFDVDMPDADPISREEHLTFSWLSLEDVSEMEVRPEALWKALLAAEREESCLPFWSARDD